MVKGMELASIPWYKSDWMIAGLVAFLAICGIYLLIENRDDDDSDGTGGNGTSRSGIRFSKGLRKPSFSFRRSYPFVLRVP